MERTFIKAGELMFKAKTFLIKNWILVITLVIATFLRLWNIDQVGFNGDEAVYAGQAATLASYREYANHFSLVRAHPLLFQFFVSIIYRFTISDVAARVISAVFGVLTVYLVHELGGILFDKRVGLLASIFMSLLPYHVIVSRQALLEPTLTFFFTLTIWLFWKYQLKRSAMLAYLVGVSSALTFLSKEVGILVVGVILFLLLFGYCNFLKKHLLIASCSFLMTVFPYILTMYVGESTEIFWNYLVWQINRPSNNPPLFYIENLPYYFSWPLLILLITGIGYAVLKHETPHVLCLIWFAVIFLFFQFLPIKGFHYLLPLTPAACLIGALPLNALRSWSARWKRICVSFFTGLTALTLLISSSLNCVFTLDPNKVGTAGFSGLPKGREAVQWIKENAPEGSRFLTIGPTMANIIRFYAPNMEVYALSVSQNPIRRNPSYQPIENPDYMIRFALVNYIVFDIYSAKRSPYFADILLRYIELYECELVYVEYSTVVSLEDNVANLTSIISIYEVRLGG